MVQDQFILADDLPKKNPWREDRLGFAPFAERLTKTITGLDYPNGYVIGLQGEWGSGKSTALNFVKAHLEKHNQECSTEREFVNIVDFQPWIVSGHKDLVSAFFKVMSEVLTPSTTWWGRLTKRSLRFSKVATDPLIEAVATVAVTVDPSAGIASKAVSAISKNSLGRLVDSFLEAPSLQSAYQSLRAALLQSGKRFLVVIDDIDRLQDEEVRSIMQMVKTVGRLPNVVYLLSYDRSKLWSVLDPKEEYVGPRFAEKIVQQELELPQPSRASLLAILDSEIEFLTNEVAENLRWQYILSDGVYRWIRHPRDVVRLANALKFSWPALRAEIDTQDLLAMEGLRLFDADVFSWIRSNRDFLFSEGRFVLAQSGAIKTAVSSLKENLSPETKDQVLQILLVLFPSKAKYFKDESTSIEQNPETVKRRGVGSIAGYDAYFGLRPSPDAIPKQTIDDIVERSNDEAYLVRILRDFVSANNRGVRNRVEDLLQEIHFRYLGTDPAHPTQEMLNALFRVGEEIMGLEKRADLLALSPRSQIEFLVNELLKLWGEKQAGAHLLSAFQTSASPAFNSDIFIVQARAFGVFPSNSPQTPLISKADLDALGKVLLPQIKAAADDGTLGEAPFYFDIVRSWKYLGDMREAKEWLSEGMAESATFLARLTKGLVGVSVSGRAREYSMGTSPDTDVYDLAVLLASCKKHLAGSNLTDDDRNRVRVVADALEQMLQAQESPEDTED